MEITVDYLKDKVHEQYLELQELRKSYDELTKSALRLDKIVKEKQEEIDQLKAREEEHQRLNGELREEIERLNNIINKAREYIKLVATDHDIMNNNEIIYTQMQYEEIENLLEILGSDEE